jgi:hypothetical protein
VSSAGGHTIRGNLARPGSVVSSPPRFGSSKYVNSSPSSSIFTASQTSPDVPLLEGAAAGAREQLGLHADPRRAEEAGGAQDLPLHRREHPQRGRPRPRPQRGEETWARSCGGTPRRCGPPTSSRSASGRSAGWSRSTSCRLGGGDAPGAADAAVEEPPEQGRAVEPGPAQPVDGAVTRNQRGRPPIPDDGIVLNLRCRSHRLAPVWHEAVCASRVNGTAWPGVGSVPPGARWP